MFKVFTIAIMCQLILSSPVRSSESVTKKKEAEFGTVTICEDEDAIGFNFPRERWKREEFERRKYYFKKIDPDDPKNSEVAWSCKDIDYSSDFYYTKTNTPGSLERCYVGKRTYEVGDKIETSKPFARICTEYYDYGTYELDWVHCQSGGLAFKPNGYFLTGPSQADYEFIFADDHWDFVVTHGRCTTM